MNIDVLLSMLENVRPTGYNKWIACCPAHKSKSKASLAIKVGDGDTVLIYCHGGCPTTDIVAAVGLELSDLFPPRQAGIHNSRPRASNLTPIIKAFENDLLVVHVLLADIGQGKPISAADRMAAKAAAGRIWSALREARYVH